MALNFPSDTSSPYTDPSSGIKYVYNAAVGAWESALQPPAIISANQPTWSVEGYLWYSTTDNQLYIYKDGAWTSAATTPTGSTVTVGSNAPSTPSIGDMWWDDVSGQLFIYIDDASGDLFWLPANPTVPTGGIGVGTGDSFPPGVEGDIFFNTNDSQLYVFDTTLGWQETQNTVSGVTEVTGTAPIQVTNGTTAPVISIDSATTANAGSVQFATTVEAGAGNVANKALTPSTLTSSIGNYLTDATDEARGVVELATPAETAAGTDTTKAVTPAGLTSALGALGFENPAGSIIMFSASTPPSGYLECDGAAVSRTTYADLFAVIGEDFGNGDGSTTFNLPDLRGEFVRGWDNGAGVDSGRALGTNQADAIINHTHSGPSGNAGSDSTKKGGGNRDSNTGTYTTLEQAGGANETRPKNIALMYCIKS